MQLLKILTPLAACAALATAAFPLSAQQTAQTSVSAAQTQGDATLVEMQQAFRKSDRKRLTALLPQAQGHALEPWAAYW